MTTTDRSRRMIRGLLVLALGIGVIAVLRIADGRAHDALSIGGATMGTSWSVKLVPDPGEARAQAFRTGIAATLDRIDTLMSTWDQDSEISRFNAYRGTDWFPVSADTREVVAAALTASRDTDGAFDITVGPLVDLWGFGPTDIDVAPAPAALAAARDRVGWQRLTTRADPPALRKNNPATRIDLSAIAKGYAVDAVAAYLDAAGSANYLVEVGGELRARGSNAAGHPWRVAIEKPAAGGRGVQRIVGLDGGAIATSGDYRNVIVLGGERYGHAIDPRSGRPVPPGVASATVLGPNAMEADALATALLVLGPAEAEAFALERQLAVLLLIHDGDGLREVATPAFADHLTELAGRP